MQQLKERVLRVVARLAPDDISRLVSDRLTVAGDALAVRLHLELLQVSGEAMQAPVVREHRERIEAEEVDVPDPEQSHQHRKIAFEWRRAEMLVHLVATGEHQLERVHAQ